MTRTWAPTAIIEHAQSIEVLRQPLSPHTRGSGISLVAQLSTEPARLPRVREVSASPLRKPMNRLCVHSIVPTCGAS